MCRYFLAVLSVAAITVDSAGAAPPSPGRTLADAEEVLADLAAIPLKGIPPALLADAHGIAIIPHVVKAGFIIAGQVGHGVVLVKDKDGKWGDPTFIHFGGGGVGFQAGVQATDVVLVFKDQKSLNRLLDGKNKLTLGADAAIAAGPVGRKAAAATDVKLQAEIYSYSRSKGLFAGVSLEGSVIHNDHRENAQFQKKVMEEDLKRLAALQTRLTEMSVDKPSPMPELIKPLDK